jgi:hypothetical protein
VSVKNVTISMRDETLAKVRIEAARAGQSVSRWIAARIADSIDRLDEKAAASARIETFLQDFAGLSLSEGGRISVDRDEIHVGRLRRFDHDPVHAGPLGPEEARDLRGVAETPPPR